MKLTPPDTMANDGHKLMRPNAPEMEPTVRHLLTRSAKRVAIAVATVSLAVSLAGCADSPDQIVADTATLTAEVVATLETVRDAASAEAAKARLAELSRQAEELDRRSVALRGTATGLEYSRAVEIRNAQFEELARRAAVARAGAEVFGVTVPPNLLDPPPPPKPNP